MLFSHWQEWHPHCGNDKDPPSENHSALPLSEDNFARKFGKSAVILGVLPAQCWTLTGRLRNSSAQKPKPKFRKCSWEEGLQVHMTDSLYCLLCFLLKSWPLIFLRVNPSEQSAMISLKVLFLQHVAAASIKPVCRGNGLKSKFLSVLFLWGETLLPSCFLKPVVSFKQDRLKKFRSSLKYPHWKTQALLSEPVAVAAMLSVKI